MAPSLSPWPSAWLRRSVKSSTRSHGMCNDTDLATPVYFSTWAASSIFSYGSRATPAWANTLNRVPELPKAHDGISIHCRRSSSFTVLAFIATSPSVDAQVVRRRSSGEVEDLGNRPDSLVRSLVPKVGEEVLHLPLPTRVDVGGGHRRLSGLEVIALEVADQRAVGLEEQRVVAPAGVGERLAHLRPDLSMAAGVLLEVLHGDVQLKADALSHGLPDRSKDAWDMDLPGGPAVRWCGPPATTVRTQSCLEVELVHVGLVEHLRRPEEQGRTRGARGRQDGVVLEPTSGELAAGSAVEDARSEAR